MSKLDDAKSVADSYLSEVDATIEIRQAYNSIVIGMSGTLMGVYKDSKYHQNVIKEALRYKTVDPSTLYRPLVVQVHGVFEHYIRSIVDAVIEDRFESMASYNDLEEGFRKEHINYAARVLVHWKEGNVMGLPYPFEVLLHNIGAGLSGASNYKLNSEIFTKFMGNPTPARLEKLFRSLSLPEPFSDDLGQNTGLRDHFGDKTKGRVAVRAKEKLERQVDFRNDIVHGNIFLQLFLFRA